MTVGTEGDDVLRILEVIVRLLVEKQYGPYALRGQPTYWPNWLVNFWEERGWK